MQTKPNEKQKKKNTFEINFQWVLQKGIKYFSITPAKKIAIQKIE